MEFWLFLALAALAGSLWIAWPFLRGRAVEMSAADGTMSIYRDQMDEIDRDLRAGLISEQECDAARAEIERRALKVAKSLDQGFDASKRSLPVAAALVLVSAGIALATYAYLGAPMLSDRPLAERQEERLTRMAEAGDITSRIQLLIRAVGENPQSFEDWWMLARSYGSIGDHASAADAYRNAAMLAEDRPAVLSAYGEAMTLANGNKVPGAARLIFEQLVQDHADPRARYYLALARAQAKDFEGAAADWAALARDSAPDAPWMALVRRDLVNMARFLDRDLAEFLPDATAAEVVAAGGGGLLPPAETEDVAGIKTAQASDPTDYRGWIALAEARAAAGDTDGARQALAGGRAAFANAPFVMQQFAAAERDLGLSAPAPAPRGPSDADIAAASEMSQAERDEMIDGMVTGLAARLEDQPDDLDGWMMLIRSYATLGQYDAAKTALAEAQGHFTNDQRAMALLEDQFASLLPR